MREPLCNKQVSRICISNYLPRYSEGWNYGGTCLMECLSKTTKFCHSTDPVFLKSCTFSLSWKIICLEKPRNWFTGRLMQDLVNLSPGPVNSPHKGPVTRKMFPFDDVIMGTDQFYPYPVGLFNWYRGYLYPNGHRIDLEEYGQIDQINSQETHNITAIKQSTAKSRACFVWRTVYNFNHRVKSYLLNRGLPINKCNVRWYFCHPSHLQNMFFKSCFHNHLVW